MLELLSDDDPAFAGVDGGNTLDGVFGSFTDLFGEIPRSELLPDLQNNLDVFASGSLIPGDTGATDPGNNFRLPTQSTSLIILVYMEWFRGMIHEIVPRPDDPEFIVPERERVRPTQLPKMPASLVPPPFTTQPPAGYSYPHSPKWSSSTDLHYTTGACYSASVSIEPGDLDREHDEQNRLTPHPTVDPVWDPVEQRFKDQSPEGMVKMVAGVPFRLDVIGEEASRTFSCFHTLDSINAMYPQIYGKILSLASRLKDEVFGKPPGQLEGGDELCPIFTLPFFRQNMRSANKGKATRVDSGISKDYDGSYSVASGIQQGDAHGTLVPIHQISYPAALERLENLLGILRDLYLELGPLSMSQFEWKLSGLKQGGIAVQVNVSSGSNGGDLAKCIGDLQGKLHVDFDVITIPTLFALILKLPPGAHEGSFVLARRGLYIREAGAWILFAFFNARDMHGGRQVSIHESMLQDPDYAAVNDLWRKAGKVNRIGIPVYFPSQAVQRTCGVAVSPPTIFGNRGSLSRSSAQSLSFARDGMHLLGSAHEAKSRLARELAFNFFNGLAQCGLTYCGQTASTVMESIKYRDSTSSDVACTVEPLSLDPMNPEHSERVANFRGYYAYLYRVASSLDLHLTRAQHKHIQKKLREALSAPEVRPMNSSAIKLLPVTLGLQPKAPIDGQDSAENMDTSSAKHPAAQKKLGEEHNQSNQNDSLHDIDVDSTSSDDDGNLPEDQDTESTTSAATQTDKLKRKPKKPPPLEPKPKKVRKDKSSANSASTTVGLVGLEFELGEEMIGEYEVEAIIGHCKRRDVVLYEVRFVGYDSGFNQWYNATELQSAAELLQQYQAAHPEVLQRRSHRANTTDSHRLSVLVTWLDPEKLQSEYSSLEKRYQSLKRDKTFFKTIGKRIQDWSSEFTLLNSVQNSCTGFLQCSPVDDRRLDRDHETAPQLQSIQMLLLRTVEASRCLPQVSETGVVLDLVRASLRWQECRSLLIINDFLASGLDKVVSVLVHAHQYLGQPFLNLHYGPFAKLVEELYEFITRARREYLQDEDWMSSSIDIPWNLYGVRPAQSTNIQTLDGSSISVTWHKTIVTTEKGLYKALTECLESLLVDQLVVPYLRSQTSYTRSKKKRQTDDDLLVGCQLRGLLLQCLVEELDDEAICATSGVSVILESPMRLFSPKISTESRLLSQIHREPEKMLDPVRDWIRNSRSSEICTVARAIAHFVNRQMVELSSGKSISDTAFDHLSEVAGTSKRSLRQFSETLPKISPSIGSHLTHQRRCVQRSIWRALLREQLPGDKLTERVGLSNLLVWMGTGQGNRTSSFIAHIGEFFSSTLADCMGRFARALKWNQGILAGHGYPPNVTADVETPPANIPHLVQISNSTIYGSACNALKLLPTPQGQQTLFSHHDTNRADLAAKFSPYWARPVQERWIDFLGDMANQNPKTYSGHRKSWSSCIRMLADLRVTGFQSGLTPMQTANALAYAEIIHRPTLNEMADWIWRNPQLGAFSGLLSLGYSLQTRRAVYVALTCVYKHLDKYLTPDDKILLGFGTISWSSCFAKYRDGRR
ncbi:hypothetical protein FPV67DRAFT_1458957, partial [Lyophyllum atratum]